MITWDENKRLANLKKHGIDFADLESVFNHYMHSEEDSSADYEEVRVKSLCLYKGHVIRLIWTDHKDAARLISCRNANLYETRTYFENGSFY